MYSTKFPEKTFGGKLSLIAMDYLLMEIAIIVTKVVTGNVKYVTMMMIEFFQSTFLIFY
jgi:hypothetical protein